MPRVINPAESQDLIEALPEPLRKAQQAVHLPEVQEMIRKLSEYGLGVHMPHMHNADGSFQPLPEATVSFEKELKVSFKQSSDPSTARALPVGWRWDERLQAVSYCDECGCHSC